MTQKHPITPPPELIGKWEEDWHHSKVKHIELEDHIAAQAAQWGADQELEACCAWVDYHCSKDASLDLSADRRPKPPSLKEEARQIIDCIIEGDCLNDDDAVTLRRVLEALDD